MRIFLLSLLFFSYSTVLCSQNEILIDDTTKISWFNKHVFFSWGLSPLTNGMYSSPKIKLPNDTFYNGSQLVSILPNYKKTFGLSIVTLTIHTRINIIDFKGRTSIAINIPLGFGPSIIFHKYRQSGSFTNQNETVVGIHGHFPILLSFNKGFHSTYNNTDNKGWWIGLGVENIISPIKVFREDSTVFRDKTFPKVWMQPVIAVGLKSVYMNSEYTPKRKGAEVYIGFLNGWSVRAMFTHIIRYD